MPCPGITIKWVTGTHLLGNTKVTPNKTPAQGAFMIGRQLSRRDLVTIAEHIKGDLLRQVKFVGVKFVRFVKRYI